MLDLIPDGLKTMFSRNDVIRITKYVTSGFFTYLAKQGLQVVHERSINGLSGARIWSITRQILKQGLDQLIYGRSENVSLVIKTIRGIERTIWDGNQTDSRNDF